MRWYCKKQGSHVWVRVFMNGAMCGELCFRVEEFADILLNYHAIRLIEFVKEGEKPLEISVADPGKN